MALVGLVLLEGVSLDEITVILYIHCIDVWG